MRSASAVLLTVVFAGMTTNGFAATSEGAAAPAKETASALSQSLDGMVGKKLIAIDGSTIALMPAEGGLAREIVGSNGAVQKTMFEFINEKLGTVSDARNVANIIGVFRMTGAGIEAQYADGSSETLAVNPSGGLTIESISTSNDSCTAWYPEGHVFSLDERRAALAQFATRLGLADPADKKAVSSKAACAPVSAPHASDVPAKADVARAAGRYSAQPRDAAGSRNGRRVKRHRPQAARSGARPASRRSSKLGSPPHRPQCCSTAADGCVRRCADASGRGRSTGRLDMSERRKRRHALGLPQSLRLQRAVRLLPDERSRSAGVVQGRNPFGQRRRQWVRLPRCG